MIFSRSCLVVFLLTLGPVLIGATSRAKPAAPDNPTASKGAIVVDAATGNVLFEDRADYSGAPASMVKLMTFAVLHDKLTAGSLTLATPIRIANEDNIGGTQVFLDPRETFSVEELIYAMMIQSANDAARSLARFSGGSVAVFVEQSSGTGLGPHTFARLNRRPKKSRSSRRGLPLLERKSI